MISAVRYIEIILTKFPLMPMPREDPAAAATTAATSVMTWNAGVSLVLQFNEYSTRWHRGRVLGGGVDEGQTRHFFKRVRERSAGYSLAALVGLASPHDAALLGSADHCYICVYPTNK